MRWFITILLITIGNLSFCQNIEHFELVSELEDSMVLINKSDVDKINKMFFEKGKLDSINRLNRVMIHNLVLKTELLDSVIASQKFIIDNKEFLIKETENRFEIDKKMYEKTIRQERNRKLTWQITSGVSWLIIILLIV